MSKTILKNPLFWADLPDPDLIRVGDFYYMVSTSMHSMPGCPIMKSRNLKDWEIVSYVYSTLEDNDAHNLLNGKDIYGQGSWAASLRYHQGTFYVCFSSNDMNQFYIYHTQNIEESNWDRYVIDGLYHDPGLLFDEDKVYVIYGCGDIRIAELTADLSAIKADGVNQLLLETKKDNIGLRCEGCHAYKINGYYYLLFIEWPSDGNQRRRQIAYRSKELLGEYERKILFDDDMGYHNKGIAQGAIFNTKDGEWYAMLFQDHDAVGRIPYLLPVNWEDGWPMIGIDGKAPEELEIPLPPSTPVPLLISDDFNYQENKLALNWQWNHNPDNQKWSLTERPGYLRLKTANITDNVLHARNTLTQRTEGPGCIASTKMDISNMKIGDYAGMIALQNSFGTIGIKVDEKGDKYISFCVNAGDGSEKEIERKLFAGETIFLKIEFNFEDSIDLANFYYSIDGDLWIKFGQELKMKYTLDHFMGYRIALFNYASKEIGGYVDFEYFNYQKENV